MSPISTFGTGGTTTPEGFILLFLPPSLSLADFKKMRQTLVTFASVTSRYDLLIAPTKSHFKEVFTTYMLEPNKQILNNQQ